MENRKKLPFRKNCEGYFLNEKGEILARKSDAGFIIFPGGGIDRGESIESGMIRETFEETGVRVIDLKPLKDIKIIWGEDWAKTEKQKKRYLEFQGDDMHFFTGEIEIIGNNLTEEDSWKEDKFMDINEVIKVISSFIEVDLSTREYRKTQIKLLEALRNG